MAAHIKEATDIKATIGDIEDWLDRLKQLAEEVRTEIKKKTNIHTNLYRCDEMRFAFNSLRTACQM